MNTNTHIATNDEPSVLPRLLRRAVTIAALVVFVATATATWMTSKTAEAAPHHEPAATACDRVAAVDAGATKATKANKTKKTKKAGDEKKAKKAKKKAKKAKKLTGKLNLNTASEQQLRLLPGVGATKARRVVEFREKHGKFKRVIDLRRVKGFGYKSVKKLQKHLTVDSATTLKYE